MKKLILSICTLFFVAQGFAQTTEEANDLSYIFSNISKYATRVDLFKSPGQYILRDPKADMWGESFNFQTSENSISIPMNSISIATVEPYGLELTGPNGQATIFMDLATDPLLRAELQNALNDYLESKKTKTYTVYEKAE